MIQRMYSQGETKCCQPGQICCQLMLNWIFQLLLSIGTLDINYNGIIWKKMKKKVDFKISKCIFCNWNVCNGMIDSQTNTQDAGCVDQSFEM